MTPTSIVFELAVIGSRRNINDSSRLPAHFIRARLLFEAPISVDVQFTLH